MRIGIAVPAALAVGVLCQGCLRWTGTTHHAAVPDHPGHAVASAEQAPRILWRMEHGYRWDGNTRDTVAAIPAAQTHTMFKRAFEIVQTKTPFLARATLDEPDPEFVLVLETAGDRRTSREWAALLLGLVPWSESREYRVRATLRTIEGAELVSHASSTEIKGTAHLLMPLLSPWIETYEPGGERFIDPMRSAIEAVATDFAALRSAGSAGAAESAATRETTE